MSLVSMYVTNSHFLGKLEGKFHNLRLACDSHDHTLSAYVNTVGVRQAEIFLSEGYFWLRNGDTMDTTIPQ